MTKSIPISKECYAELEKRAIKSGKSVAQLAAEMILEAIVKWSK